MFDFAAYKTLPCIDGLERYVLHGIEPGGFVMAILNNDLLTACNKADVFNRHLIWRYVNCLQNEAPTECWGDAQRVKKWMAAGGMKNKPAPGGKFPKVGAQ